MWLVGEKNAYSQCRAHNCMIDEEGNWIIFGRTQDVRNIIGAGNMTSYMPRVLRSFNKYVPSLAITPSLFKNTVVDTRFPSILPIDDGKCVDVAASMALSFALTDSRISFQLFLLYADHIYAYGYNRYGQCGGDVKDVQIYKPIQVQLDEDEVPLKVVCGFQHACCLCESGRAYAWGKADHGQLGRGDVDLTFKPMLVYFFPLLILQSYDFGLYYELFIIRWIQILLFIIRIFMLVLARLW